MSSFLLILTTSLNVYAAAAVSTDFNLDHFRNSPKFNEIVLPKIYLSTISDTFTEFRSKLDKLLFFYNIFQHQLAKQGITDAVPINTNFAGEAGQITSTAIFEFQAPLETQAFTTKIPHTICFPTENTALSQGASFSADFVSMPTVRVGYLPKPKRPLEDLICGDYIRGRCTLNEKCKYLHIKAELKNEYLIELSRQCKNPITFCREHLKDSCPRGILCRFVHGTREEYLELGNPPLCKQFLRGQCQDYECLYQHQN